jgi:hypothetical protein
MRELAFHSSDGPVALSGLAGSRRNFVMPVWLAGILFAANMLIHARRRDVRMANAQDSLC